MAPAGPLTALESGTVNLFQRSTRSVVNVVDLTVLSGQAMRSGAVVPEVRRAAHKRRIGRGEGKTRGGETKRGRSFSLSVVFDSRRLRSRPFFWTMCVPAPRGFACIINRFRLNLNL